MRLRLVSLAALAPAVLTLACQPSDILSVPTPAGVVSGSNLHSQAGAESQFNTAKYQSYDGLVGNGGIASFGELMSDEFNLTDFAHVAAYAGIDSRRTVQDGGLTEEADWAWNYALAGRELMFVALPALRQYEPVAGQSKIGEAWALIAFSELLIAEDYCSGSPLSDVQPGGAINYGMPLTTDSLLGVVEAHFDSALANAHGNATIEGFAHYGHARALLGRARYDSAAAEAHQVPTAFAYNSDLAPTYGDGGIDEQNWLAYMYGQAPNAPPYNYTLMGVADHKGGNGLPFRAARDPRVPLDSTVALSADGATWYYPKRFEGAMFEYLPLATGTEARLIEAEAALHDGAIGAWTGDLNALREAAGMSDLTADSTTTASDAMRVDVMFRERAFWLYGLGTRLGDLRRLVRQYGRDAESVYPTGAYEGAGNPYLSTAIPTYGADVSLTLPTPAGSAATGVTVTNPHYQGCLDHNA